MGIIQAERSELIAADLAAWFRAQARDLPWRKSYDPYQVWISEVMLQQTKVDTVLPYFARWMEIFPDLATLAKADLTQLLKAWEGLGYYSRVKNLHLAAQEMATTGIPAEVDQLLKLPGIGPYTAGAIASIAFNQKAPLLDGNVKRVLSRLLDWEKPILSKESETRLLTFAQSLLAHQSPRVLNQGLMELGALICLPKNPACQACPWVTHCQARLQGTVRQRPLTPPRPRTIKEKKWFWVFEHQGRYLVQRQCEGKLWAGMPLFPFQAAESDPIAALNELVAGEPRELCRFKYAVTIYQVQAVAYQIPLHEIPVELAGGEWLDLKELEALALPRPGVKIRQALAQLETN